MLHYISIIIYKNQFMWVVLQNFKDLNSYDELNVDNLAISLNNELFDLKNQNLELEKEYLHLSNQKVELGLKLEFIHEQISELYIYELEHDELSVEEDEEILNLKLQAEIIENDLSSILKEINIIEWKKDKLAKAIVRMKKRWKIKANIVEEFELIACS